MTYAPVRAGDLKRSVLDPSDFTRRLGAPTSFADGLAKTVLWFRGR